MEEILKISFLQREGVCLHVAFTKLFGELQLRARDTPKGKKRDFEVLPDAARCYAPRHSLHTRWAVGIGVQIFRWASACVYVAFDAGNTDLVPQ